MSPPQGLAEERIAHHRLFSLQRVGGFDFW